LALEDVLDRRLGCSPRSMMPFLQRFRHTCTAIRIAPLPSSAAVVERPALNTSPAAQRPGVMFE